MIASDLSARQDCRLSLELHPLWGLEGAFFNSLYSSRAFLLLYAPFQCLQVLTASILSRVHNQQEDRGNKTFSGSWESAVKFV